MVNPFQIAAERMAEYGFFGFLLPWIITAAIFWGLLKKSEIFPSDVVNGVLALGVSFFLWGYLISPLAAELATSFSTFFTQLSVVVIVFLFGIIGASMFHPELRSMLTEVLKGGGMLWGGIVVAILLFFTSGLSGIVFRRAGGLLGDVTMMVYILFALIIGVLIISLTTGGKK